MFTLPDLPYAYNALEPYIDERTMQIHHDKHHAAYIKNVNDALTGHDDLLAMNIEDLIKNLSKVPEDIRTKVRNNGGGHANHSMFWTVMAPNGKSGGGLPSGEVAKAIDSAFGNFVQFQEKFAAVGLGRFGSGWVWLVKDGGASAGSGQGKLAIVDTPNQDNPLMEAVPAGRQGKTPILGLDVWEHAYYLKYQNVRTEYIKSWWNVVNWKEVERRYAAS